MHDFLNKRHYWSTSTDDINIDSASDAAVFSWPVPVDITRIFALATTAVVNAAGVVDLTLYRRPTIGSDTGISAALAVFQLTGTTTIAAGQVVYRDLVEAVAESTVGSSVINVGPAGPIHLDPGQELKVVVSNASDSGVIVWGLEFVELPLNIEGDNVTKDVT